MELRENLFVLNEQIKIWVWQSDYPLVTPTKKITGKSEWKRDFIEKRESDIYVYIDMHIYMYRKREREETETETDRVGSLVSCRSGEKDRKKGGS